MNAVIEKVQRHTRNEGNTSSGATRVVIATKLVHNR
jgi:hypothetical protein